MPQDELLKSDPSNGLVERLRKYAKSLRGPVLHHVRLIEEAADALALYHQEGVLSSQRGEALESILAKLGVVETIMVNKGWHRQAVGGYLTDAGLWLDRAMSELRKLVSHAEGENGSANASPSAMPSATTDALSLLLELIPFLSSRGSVTGVRIIVGHEPSERLLSALERLEQDRTSPDRLRLSTGPGDVATGEAAPGDKSASPATPIGGLFLGVEGDQGASVARSGGTAQAPKSDSDGGH